MSYDFEAIKLNGFVFSNTGLLFGNADLLSNRVHAFEIRQEQAAAASFFNDDAVNFWIEFVFRRDLFSRFQDINLVNKIFQLFRLDRREARVSRAGRNTVGDDFARDIGLSQFCCADAYS